MLDVLRRSLRSPDLRRKLGVTLGLVLLFRVGSQVPAPGVSYSAVRACVATAESSLYGLVNLLTGGALLQLAVLALGVIPYITASIIFQLLTVVVPRLETLKKEGQRGQAKITQYTRYTTVALAALQAGGVLLLARGVPPQLFPNCNQAIFPDTSFLPSTLFVVTLTAGALLAMWFGERITERGVGNGISLVIFASIAASVPGQAVALWETRGVFFTVLVGAAALLLVIGVVYVEQAQRRIQISYPGAVRGGAASRGGQSTYLPLKVNQAGVIPVIFASSLLTLPTIIAGFMDPTSGFATFVAQYLTLGNNPVYLTAFVAMVIFFAFFYVSITFDPVQRADDLRSSGGFIPGVRPGMPTAKYIDRVLVRLTSAGSLYLALVAALPLAALSYGAGASAQAAFGGTSLLILVGVSLDTVKQLEANTQTQRVTGFLSRSRSRSERF